MNPNNPLAQSFQPLSVIPAPSVIPAKAGIQCPRTHWIPACARMTRKSAVIPAKAGIQGPPEAMDPRDKPEDDAMRAEDDDWGPHGRNVS